MTFVPGGYAHVVCPIQQAGQTRPMAITWGAGDGTLPASQASADLIRNRFISPMQAVFDTTAVLGPLDVSIGVGGGATLPFSAGPPVNGTRVITAQPPNVACLVRKITNLAGRAGRGRLFMPACLDDADVDELGIVLPARVNTINVQLGIWISTGAGAQEQLVLLHSEVAPPPTPIVNMFVQNLVATQRRRLGR